MDLKQTVDLGFRNQTDQFVRSALEEVFTHNSDRLGQRLEDFPKFARRQNLARFLAFYEIFKKIKGIKGSIIECGVFRGAGLLTWAKLSSIVEPYNWMRRVYGFDTFEGFNGVAEEDSSEVGRDKNNIVDGAMASNSFSELQKLIDIYDANRFLGHLPKVELVKGDARQTIPKFMEDHAHLVISLLILDFDLYEPTKIALENFVPRMPKGSIIVFDELDHPMWPGETQAVLETIGINNLKIERFDLDPILSYAIVE